MIWAFVSKFSRGAEMEVVARRRLGRAFLAPLVALALIVGYVIYTHTGSGTASRPRGAPAVPAPAPKKLTAGDLLLAASTAKGIYLQYDNVSAPPSTVHTNHIPITSFQWGMGVAAPPPTGGTPGKPNLSDITLSKQTDKYTVPLLNKSFRTQRVLRATLYFTGVNASGTAFDYLEFDLKDAFITGYSMSSGGDVPSESLSLNYTRLTIVAHIPGASPQTLTYDIPTNTTT
jgi:type VI secretion system secreted protein Hcp